MPISWNEIRHNAIKFSGESKGARSESAEKQTFWNEFFQVFGLKRRVVASFESRPNGFREPTASLICSGAACCWSSTKVMARPRQSQGAGVQLHPRPGQRRPARGNPDEKLMTNGFFTKSQRSSCMSAIKNRGNKNTELKLVAILRSNHINGWRRHEPLPGKPDFIFRHARVAVFVDGCFWHGCRWHCRMPKSRTVFWRPKLAGNKARDRKVNQLLKAGGWLVIRIWEHALRDSDRVVARIQAALASQIQKS